MSLKDRFMQTVTEADGVTLCPVRITALLAVTGYHSLIAFMLGYQHVSLGMADCGLYIQHMSLLGTSLGIGVGAKSIMKGDAQ
jgi:hypothetical protein